MHAPRRRAGVRSRVTSARPRTRSETRPFAADLRAGTDRQVLVHLGALHELCAVSRGVFEAKRFALARHAYAGARGNGPAVSPV